MGNKISIPNPPKSEIDIDLLLPLEDEWLFYIKELGQSVDKYINSPYNKITEERNIIDIIFDDKKLSNKDKNYIELYILKKFQLTIRTRNISNFIKSSKLIMSIIFLLINIFIFKS